MRKKFFIKLGVLGLAAIFLLSMSSYGPAQKGGKGGKGGKEPPELYKVTISINGDAPGIETLDMGLGCGSGYFYAEREGGKNLLLHIVSQGSKTPGPNGEPAGDLNMWVKTGVLGNNITLENCTFSDGGSDPCHGETGYSPGEIFFRFLTSYDGPGENEDIQIRWWLDFTEVQLNKKKTGGRGWNLYSLMYDEGTYLDQYVISSNPNPPIGMEVGDDPWETDVIGPFVLHHDGKACLGDEDMYNREVLEGFDIHLTIQRVR